MAMFNGYRDFIDGVYVPQIKVERIGTDGPYRARAHKLEAIHIDQAEAVNQLTEKLRQGILSGAIGPEA